MFASRTSYSWKLRAGALRTPEGLEKPSIVSRRPATMGREMRFLRAQGDMEMHWLAGKSNAVACAHQARCRDPPPFVLGGCDRLWLRAC